MFSRWELEPLVQAWAVHRRPEIEKQGGEDFLPSSVFPFHCTPQKWPSTLGEYGRPPAPTFSCPCSCTPPTTVGPEGQRGYIFLVSCTPDVYPRRIRVSRERGQRDHLSPFCFRSNLLKANRVPSILLSTSCASSHVIPSDLHHDLHFTDRETEAQSGEVLS